MGLEVEEEMMKKDLDFLRVLFSAIYLPATRAVFRLGRLVVPKQLSPVGFSLNGHRQHD